MCVCVFFVSVESASKGKPEGRWIFRSFFQPALFWHARYWTCWDPTVVSTAKPQQLVAQPKAPSASHGRDRSWLLKAQEAMLDAKAFAKTNGETKNVGCQNNMDI